MSTPSINLLTAVGKTGLAKQLTNQNTRTQDGVTQGGISAEELASLKSKRSELAKFVVNATTTYSGVGEKEAQRIQNMLTANSDAIYTFRHNA